MANLISLYNKIAGEYDKNGKRGSWYSPQVLFGLHFPFVNPKTSYWIWELGLV